MAYRMAVIWSCLHLLFAGLGQVMALSTGDRSPGGPLALSPASALWVAALAALLGMIDSRRRNEPVLLGNLGVSEAAIALAFLAMTGAAELVLGIALR